MYLVTGGLGFIGLNTAAALLDLGESVVLTRHNTSREPAFLTAELGRRAFVETLDVTDREALLGLGDRYEISGIVHLATVPGTGLVDGLLSQTRGLLNVLDAAEQWKVRRVAVASTIGVYMGVEDANLREDVHLPMVGTHPIPTFKKSAELLATLVGNSAAFDVAMLRIAGIWGPFGRRESVFMATPGLVNAAVEGRRSPRVYADEGIDLCYARDCGRAIALVATAPTLNHSVYNIGTGRLTTNREVAAAVRAVIPDADIDLVDGRNPAGPPRDVSLDITRLRADTGFEPAYPIDAAVADYVNWRRSVDSPE